MKPDMDVVGAVIRSTTVSGHRRVVRRAVGTVGLALTSLLAACGEDARLPASGEPASARAALTTVVSPGAARCAAAHAGGDWRSLNGDLANTRNQRHEHLIHPSTASSLSPAWSFDAAAVGVTGGMRTTPVVADGCVYLAFGQGYLGERGDVVALHADTGALVWHAQIEGSVLGMAVQNGLVYVTPSKGTREITGEIALPVVTGDYAPAGSFVLALDAQTGRQAWISERLDDGDAANGTFINASPVVFEAGGRKLLFTALAGGGGDGARVPMYFLDALTGKTIRKAYSLSNAEYEAGFGGTGIWATAAYDGATQHLYAGTSDSDGRTKQHPYNNAVLKIDANPKRASFASVVSAYSGISEHADLDPLIGSQNNPLCALAGNDSAFGAVTFFDTSASPACLELDLDFGASPNLYAGADGVTRVGALQKAGVYHSIDTRDMTADWRQVFGPGGPAMSSATGAVVDDHLLIDATPNLLYRVRQEGGGIDWVTSTGLDALAYQPISAANGVAYTITNTGTLLAFDVSSGQMIMVRDVASDGGLQQCLGVGSGVAIARNKVYAPCDAGGLNDLAGLPHSPGGLVVYALPDSF